MPVAEVEGGERISAPGGMFLLKADIDVADAQLRALRADAGAERSPDAGAVTRAIEALGPGAVRALGRPSRGTFRWVVPAVLETGDAVVLRVNRLPHPALVAGLRREFELTDRLRSEGIPVPRALALDAEGASSPGASALTRAASGRTLAELDEAEDEDGVRTGLQALGARLRRLHELRGEGAGPLELPISAEGRWRLRGACERWGAYLGTRLEAHLSVCVDAGALDAAEAERAAALLEGLEVDEEADRLLHGDPGGPNIFVKDGEISALIDWEDALIGDPVFDVASATLFHPQRRWGALFRGYWGTDGLPEEVAHRFWLYQLRISLARTVVRRRFALRDRPGREPAAARVGRALAHALEGGA